MVNSLKTIIINRILYLLFYPSWRRFWRKSSYLEKVQTKYLLDIAKKNSYTAFGKKYNFIEIHSINDFQRQVPICNYEDYIDYIKAIKSGENNVLTVDAVKKFSLSSGTATASKLIPNTKALIKEFDNCINVWLFDLYQHFPQLLNGRAFWIITPSTKTTITEGAIKNGFDNDSEYFPPIKQWFIRNIFVIPDEVAKFCQGENYYFVLAVFLLSDKNLRLISVWNPSVLLILLEKALNYQQQIIEALESGHLIVPEPINNIQLKILEKLLKRNPQRANELKKIFNSKVENAEIWSVIWPKLVLISAWENAWASNPAKQVKKLFPKVIFQGKGLLATEACVTFPVYDENQTLQYIPAFTSHFFEFENTESKMIKLLHQLEANCSYEIIVTTAGGFYRYRLNDIVTCYGISNGLPLLHFDGKNNLISDISGEKLHENFISQILKKVFEELKIESPFYFLAPEITEKSSFYSLFIYSKNNIDPVYLQQKLESDLCENFHYKHCRVLGQLCELQIQILNEESINRFYEIIQVTTHIGSFKQLALRKETFWKSKLVNI